MSLPTASECLDFLKSSRSAIPDIHGHEHTWMIDGVEYPEARAILLAEYALLTGQPLTSLATIEAAVNLARRIATLEIRLKSLDKDHIDHLTAHSRRKHWWSRG